MPCTERQLLANRRNAQKSTGPKTIACKLHPVKIERRLLEQAVIKILEGAL